jgi:hypothetical protein
MKKMTRRAMCVALSRWGVYGAGLSRSGLMGVGLGSAGAGRGVAQLITGQSHVQSNAQPNAGQLESKLDMSSSSDKLVEVFRWARSQAMAYVFDEGDPVGPWYEAVEPGREGFCIRDTCHQALGAQTLGLERFNLNMLRRFAESVSDAKDWCSYWEIDRYNRPAPVDYENDAAFWYNLPANFDLVDCCFRMYVWTGDRTYVEDPVFLNLYERTASDYVERWGLDLDQIMSRPRLLNMRGIYDSNKKFPQARGIPGYDEGEHEYVVGFDVLVTQRAAYLAYAHVQQVRGNAERAQEFLAKAAALEALIKDKWWNKTGGCFYQRLTADHKLEDCGPKPGDDTPGGADRTPGLDWRRDVVADAGGFPPGPTGSAELADAAVAQLLDLSHARLEYPEVSFSRVGDLVTDLMGVTLEFRSPLEAAVDGGWVEVTVRTLPGLGSGIAWAEMRNLPIRAGEVTVRHEGTAKTTLTSERGPALIWRAAFAGRHERLFVNGQPMEAQAETAGDGQAISSVRVAVGAGGAVTVGISA